MKENDWMIGRHLRLKGYNVDSGYMGYVYGKWMLFASESDYIEYMEDDYED